MGIAERKDLIVDLYFNQTKTFRDIAKIVHVSPKYIKQVIDQEKQKRFHDAVIQRIKEGKTIKEITIEFDLDGPQIDKIWQQYLSYYHRDSLFQLYSKIKKSPEEFLNLCYVLYGKNLTNTQLQELIYMQERMHQYGEFFLSLQTESYNLTSEISEKERRNFELANSIKKQQAIIEKNETITKNLEDAIAKNKHELHITRLSELLIKRGKNYDDFKKNFLQRLNNDEFLSNLITDIVILSVTRNPFTMYDNDSLSTFSIPTFDNESFMNEFSMDDFGDYGIVTTISTKLEAVVCECKKVIKDRYLNLEQKFLQ